jgi:hypothetical protein
MGENKSFNEMQPCFKKDCVHEWLNTNNITDITNSSFLNAKFPSNMSQTTNNYFFGTTVAMTGANGLNVTDKMRSSFGLGFDHFYFSCMFSLNDCSPSDWLSYYDAKYGIKDKLRAKLF